MRDRPLISIGLPVYNGERYLRESLNSLLDQDYANFEITISDNASTDATGLICREFVERDTRVRYYRTERNMGAVWNFNRVFELSGGEYFMWAAFDDLREKQYLRKCLDALEAHPEAVLCCTDVGLIDEEGRKVEAADDTYGTRPVGSTPRQRLRSLARSNYWYDHYGLIRSQALRQTRMAQRVWGFDVVLLAKLCLSGEVLNIPERLFLYRVFQKKTQHDAAETLGVATNQNKINVSWSHLSLEVIKGIWFSALGRAEKLRLTLIFLYEFCMRNASVNAFIREDAMASARRSLDEKNYTLCLKLLFIGVISLPKGLLDRARTCFHYRFGKMRAWYARDKWVRN